MKLTYLDSGHYLVSKHDAGRLARRGPLGRLPKPGHEARVILDDGREGWLTRTKHQGAVVWAIHGLPAAKGAP